ncbi:MAG: hypothetical protein AAGJ31_07765, partial [Verrucomicrobiota bacterium]
TNVTQFPVVFEAKKDAPLGGALASLWGHGKHGDTPLSSKYTHKVDWVRSNPVNTLYYETELDELPVGVIEPLPFRLELEPPSSPLVRNGQTSMKVVAHRSPGFTKPITVRWMWRPPGVSCNSTVTIPEGKNSANFNLSANGNAELRTWKVCAQGESNGGKGVMFGSSDLVDLTVGESLVDMKMVMTTVKRGGKSEILIEVNDADGFEKDAKVSLVGMPPKTKTSPVTLSKGQKEIRFAIEAADDAPVGQHKNLFCQLEIPVDGKTVRQRSAFGGILRVDPKPKVVVASNQKKPSSAPSSKAPAKKSLSRLEQLRLEAKTAAGQP